MEVVEVSKKEFMLVLRGKTLGNGKSGVLWECMDHRGGI